MKRPTRQAFTLIELLVVLAIIAILISLLMPSIRMAKSAACIAVCAGQQKQIGLAAHLYTLDYNGTFPIGELGLQGSPSYINSLSGNAHHRVLGRIRPEDEALYEAGRIRQFTHYVNETDSVFECCADHGQRPGYPHGPRPGSLFDQTGTSYTFNTGAWQIDAGTIPMPIDPPYHLVHHDWGLWGRHIDNMPDPTRLVMINEWSFYWLISQDWPGAGFADWGDGRFFVFHGELGPTPALDHVSMNHVFVDGHGEFQPLRHDPTPRSGSDPHWYNEDYEYAQPPL